MLKLVDLVENNITKDLNGTKGAVHFDGLSCNITHYVAVIA